MATDIKQLKACGISSLSYKKVFSALPADYPPKVSRLVQLISQHVKDGKSRNFREWRTYAAIDIAFDAPWRQTTPTMINHILSQNLTLDQTLAAVKEWGLKEEDLFLKVKNADGVDVLVPNPPVFFSIVIPIVRSYTIMREAKLFNERNLNPLLPYRPLKQTSRNQVLCEIVTDLIQTISTQYGYSSVMKQAIHQCLKYGIAIAFPEEEWHSEKQLHLGDTKPHTVKEGLRYILPHPTRMFYDMRRPLTRINSDTGCEFMGTWYIRSYGDILDSPLYWNRKRIFCGTNWLDAELSGSYFQEFFPCQMRFPVNMSGGRPPQREDIAAWYSSGNRDQAVFLTEYYAKIVPSDWGLGEYKNGRLVKTYKHPVWHHFTLAGDDTVVWAEPCAYAPTWFMGYDYDENAGRNSSLALECIPWQDHVGNILSQIILTAKQNLANLTFFDKQIVDEKDIDKLQNQGEMRYRGQNFVGFDSLMNQKAGLSVRDAFVPVQLAKQGIQELLQMFPMVLNIMERVLQISAQEAGAAASHQQSKAEVLQTGGASTNRVVYTGAGIDDGIDAWKRQLYDAAMAYMDASVSAEVSADIPDLMTHLSELGFTVKDKGDNSLLVSGEKHSLRLEGFASTAQSGGDAKEKEIAQVIFQTVGTIAAQPELFKEVGAKNLLSLIEEAAKLAGAPRDFKLRAQEGQPGDQSVPDNVVAAIQQAQQATMQAVEEKIAKPVAQEIAGDQQQLGQIQQVLKQLQGIYQIAAQTQDKNSIVAKKTQADIARRDAVARADVKRRDALAAAQVQTEQAKVAGELQILEQRTKGELAVKAASAAHAASVAEKTTSQSTEK